MSSPLLSSPLNPAWANRTSSGWHCICGERLWILAGPDTQNFAIHCQGKKHRAGISIPQKPQRQLAITQFFSAAPARASEANNPPPHDSDRDNGITPQGEKDGTRGNKRRGPRSRSSYGGTRPATAATAATTIVRAATAATTVVGAATTVAKKQRKRKA